MPVPALALFKIVKEEAMEELENIENTLVAFDKFIKSGIVKQEDFLAYKYDYGRMYVREIEVYFDVNTYKLKRRKPHWSDLWRKRDSEFSRTK